MHLSFHVCSCVLDTVVCIQPNYWQYVVNKINGVAHKNTCSLAVNDTYIFEASVKHLKLLFSELGLLLQFVQALGSVAHGGQLKVILNAVC